eukprot:TRINITY_DN21761_c0_g1_i2.p1 TRINITY_DN21761_c0_g1~~TRINITY_DN21761_c0_g1_i2.p1  ORF type:complete len:183 (+),score=46.77 TRINITY_DN21761_c0_g1_i2:351-899(+)
MDSSPIPSFALLRVYSTLTSSLLHQVNVERFWGSGLHVRILNTSHVLLASPNYRPSNLRGLALLDLTQAHPEEHPLWLPVPSPSGEPMNALCLDLKKDLLLLSPIAQFGGFVEEGPLLELSPAGKTWPDSSDGSYHGVALSSPSAAGGHERFGCSHSGVYLLKDDYSIQLIYTGSPSCVTSP